MDPRVNLLVHEVARHRAWLFNKLMESHGLTRAQSWAIGVLVRKGGLTQTELAAAMNLTRVSTGTLIARLETAGWVERRSDEADARVKRVFLTAKCRPIRRLINIAAKEVNRIGFSNFSEQEVGMLISLLERMRDNFERRRAVEPAAEEGPEEGLEEEAVLPRTARPASARRARGG
jgi:DNA-binding MarR family transcriptional regulator